MFIIGNFLFAVAKVSDVALSCLLWIIVIRALISWVNPDPYNPIVRFLYAATDPVFDRLRRTLPLYFGGFDFSPIIVLMSSSFNSALSMEISWPPGINHFLVIPRLPKGAIPPAPESERRYSRPSQ